MDIEINDWELWFPTNALGNRRPSVLPLEAIHDTFIFEDDYLCYQESPIAIDIDSYVDIQSLIVSSNAKKYAQIY